jgi:dCTP deaminase
MSIIPGQKISQNWVYPFFHRSKIYGMTYGLSAAGYDIRIAQDIWLFPGVMRLASSIERFQMPNDVLARVCDKSSWARRGVFVQNTVIEPGWSGYLTLELTRGLPWPIRIKAGSPIAQIIFERLEEPTYYPYAGKYQNQRMGPQPAIDER